MSGRIAGGGDGDERARIFGIFSSGICAGIVEICSEFGRYKKWCLTVSDHHLDVHKLARSLSHLISADKKGLNSDLDCKS